MNIFEKAIEDVFSIPEFQETFILNGKEITCISYEISQDTLYTQFGIDEGISFYLTCKIKDYTSPKKGDRISFRGNQYKLDSFTADSFNLTYKLYLRSLTSK